MKKMKPSWAVFLITFISMFFYQSCDLDDSYRHPASGADKVTIATIKAISDDENEDEFYFLIDSGKKMYPQNKDSFASKYKWVDGQRAFVYFNLFEESVEGYEYNAEIVYIENILTKGVIDMDEETADSIGDDRIKIEKTWFGGDHLNITFTFKGTQNPTELHMVNLVHNTMNETEVENGYLVLEFRHNNHGDYQHVNLSGIVSFRPPFTNNDELVYKGLKLRYYSLSNGIQYELIDFDSKNNESTSTYSGKVLDIK